MMDGEGERDRKSLGNSSEMYEIDIKISNSSHLEF
jgi:hypothetical protein